MMTIIALNTDDFILGRLQWIVLVCSVKMARNAVLIKNARRHIRYVEFALTDGIFPMLVNGIGCSRCQMILLDRNLSLILVGFVIVLMVRIYSVSLHSLQVTEIILAVIMVIEPKLVFGALQNEIGMMRVM